MNIPIWLVLIAPPVFAMIGFFACAVLAMGRVADDHSGAWIEGYNVGFADGFLDGDSGNTAAHTRVTDALAAKNARIQTLTDIARSQQSIKSGRIIDVLEG